MVNTHERTTGEICEYLRRNAYRLPHLALYPSMPYAHKYVNAVAEKGIFGALKEFILADRSAGDIIGILAKGGMTLFEKGHE